MASSQTQIAARETLKCEHCHLVQFRTTSGICRRCKNPYEKLTKSTQEETLVTVKPAPISMSAIPKRGQPSKQLLEPKPQSTPVTREDWTKLMAISLRFHRKRLGLSQLKLAQKMNGNMFWICKIESRKRLVGIEYFQRIATAMDIRFTTLLNGPRIDWEEELEELSRCPDEIVQEVLKILPYLRPAQKSKITFEVKRRSKRRGSRPRKR